MMHTTWYRDGAIVLNSRKIENERCDKDKPSSIPHNNTYTDSYYDKYISGRVSVNCTYYQHNLTLTTELTVHDGSVWRCVDSRNRGSNNLTLDFPETSRTDQTLPSRPSTVQQLPLKSTQILEGSTQDISEATEESTTPLTDSATTITTDSDTHGSFVSGFPGTGYKTSSQLIDSTTTLAKLTSIKITTAPEIDNKDEAIYISVGAVVCVVLFIIIVICVCVVRKRRMGVVTEAHSDADNGAELTAAPTNATIKIHIDGRINSPDHRNQVQPGDKKEHLTMLSTLAICLPYQTRHPNTCLLLTVLSTMAICLPYQTRHPNTCLLLTVLSTLAICLPYQTRYPKTCLLLTVLSTLAICLPYQTRHPNTCLLLTVLSTLAICLP
ncbi:uncharacterized protein [Haliotis cracherodii]|uniref:uncharacterized protein isoform X2 n=1 Tax=Haliotis cracherodii TaxID=6455 RepID=UPI0039E98C61